MEIDLLTCLSLSHSDNADPKLWLDCDELC